LLNRNNQIVGGPLAGVWVVFGKQRAQGTQRFLQRDQAQVVELLADEGGRCLVG
jgi:hypothetical protein